MRGLLPNALLLLLPETRRYGRATQKFGGCSRKLMLPSRQLPLEGLKQSA